MKKKNNLLIMLFFLSSCIGNKTISPIPCGGGTKEYISNKFTCSPKKPYNYYQMEYKLRVLLT